MIWFIWGILIALAVAAAVWLSAGLWLYRRAFRRRTPPPVPEGAEADEKLPPMQREGVRFCAERFPEEVWLRQDGLWMHAFWLDLGSDRTAVLLHGCGGHAADRFGSVPVYAARGFNLLLPDLRAHGSSEGRLACLTAKDAADAAGWVRWLRTNAKTPQRVLLDGVCSGAAAALTAPSVSEDGLPEVRLILADGAYTGVREELLHRLRRLPDFAAGMTVTAAEVWCRLLTGCSLRTPSALEAVSRSRVPTLFIQGQKDACVPPKMSEQLYDACGGPKRLLRVPEADCALSLETDPALVLAALDEMIGQFIPPGKAEE